MIAAMAMMIASLEKPLPSPAVTRSMKELSDFFTADACFPSRAISWPSRLALAGTISSSGRSSPNSSTRSAGLNWER